jgi:type I restriction enzyme S subunit
MIEPILDKIESWSTLRLKKQAVGRGKSNGFESLGEAKLKEVILYFAFKGLLVEQVESEGTGEELLQSVKLKFEKLIKDGEIKKRRGQKNNQEVIEAFKVPKSWCWSTLGDVCFKLTDGSHNPPKNAGEGIPMLSSQNVKEGVVDFSNPSRYVTAEQFEIEDKRTQLKAGDVLLTIVASLGRSAVVPSNAPPFSLQRSVAVLDSGLNSEFLSLQLESPLCRSYYDSHAKGTAQKGIYLGKLSQMPIVIPPLEEQVRIVNRVKELFMFCDELKQRSQVMYNLHEQSVDAILSSFYKDNECLSKNWKQIVDQFEFLFSTSESVEKLESLILHLAITGKFDTRDTKDTPSSELLGRLVLIRKEFVETGMIKKQKKLKEISEDEKTFVLPQGWEWARLQDVLDVRDGTHDSPKTVSKGGVPLVTSKDFKNGRIDFDGAKRISEKDHEEIAKRSLVEVDDILFSMIGGNIGNQVQVKDSRPFSIKNVALFKYYDKEITSPDYVKVYLENLAIDLQEKAKGGAQPFFGLGAFRNLVIALPPYEEQIRIVERVRFLQGITKDLKKSLLDLNTDKLAMINSIDNIMALDH